jgi:hypothetical protein
VVVDKIHCTFPAPEGMNRERRNFIPLPAAIDINGAEAFSERFAVRRFRQK